jgi:hypothetical protein
MILPEVLYGCESWSLILREEHRLKVFGNRMQRMIFGSKRNEITEGCRKSHNEELHDVCSSTYIIRMIKTRTIRCATDVARMRKKGNAYRYFMGKPEG